MQEKFLTPHEKKILDRRKALKERYIVLSEENPNIPPTRIMRIVAEEFDMSQMGVYKLLRAMGVYKKQEGDRCKRQAVSIPMP